MPTIKTVTDATFDAEVLRSPRPVLVDFWAEWCPPCKRVAPALEAIAAERHATIKVAKLDIEENPEVTRRYGVMSYPTLALFVDGVERARLIGAMPKHTILARLGEFLQ